MTRRITTC